jgi:coenzyme Q-binding protein COQ10
MQSVLIVIHILIVVALIVVVLLQRSEGGALGAGGGTGSFMTGRGQANALSRATAILGALFFGTALLMSILSSWSRAPHSILPGGPAPAGQTAPTPISPGNILDQLKKMEGGSSAPSAPASAPAAPAPVAPAPKPWRSESGAKEGCEPLPLFRDERRVRHNAVQMFDLVADVERYPQFVPLCKALRVRHRKSDAEGRETLVASMSVGYKLIRETFTSRVDLDKPNLKVRVEYIDGPFSRLENVWTFKDEPEGQGSRVEFFIDYEFKSRTLGLLMGSMFDAAFRKFAGAFEHRADAVYGRS